MDWTSRFEGLAAILPAERERLLHACRVLRVPAGTVVFGPGRPAENMLLLVSGRLRVQKVGGTGREIVLYRVVPGESCILTTACLLSDELYSAEGLTEADSVAVAIPRALFDDLLGGSACFRRFVFGAYGRRIVELFLAIDRIAFGRTDVRLAQKLLQLAAGGRVAATHASLATELGTAREVVSRQLAAFRRRGWVVPGARGEVLIRAPEALAALAGSEGPL
jgi:CRP/FNR family transcriptional regulator, anaerobic regulatory protein